MKDFFSAIHLILTLNCQQSARLTCESFERKLSFSERTAVNAHQWICKSSRELGRQLRAMDAAMHHEFSKPDSAENLAGEFAYVPTDSADGPRESLQNQAPALLEKALTDQDSVLHLSQRAKHRILRAIRQASSEGSFDR